MYKAMDAAPGRRSPSVDECISKGGVSDSRGFSLYWFICRSWTQRERRVSQPKRTNSGKMSPHPWPARWRPIRDHSDSTTLREKMTMPSLQSRLDEFKKAFESGAPPYNAPRQAIETMHRATAELKDSGLEQAALRVGDVAPPFSLFNQDHVLVNSADLLRQGPVVVSYFRGHW